ncbi:type I restriction enzyme M protein [Natronocella acetinitrilica]|uniref:site-specific DNA-methyltransferase (adenine-specific) n=1 Tax=Natronocella acetinitrilica TaxID=414046 RepID=A0AAE3KBB7_9GAMM|nr:N-6 DNA methylase [Natronocella acetinitrilica]MCP1674481.1 type I restriction enzyme M protein [Natronocella acetinitrilica]
MRRRRWPMDSLLTFSLSRFRDVPAKDACYCVLALFTLRCLSDDAAAGSVISVPEDADFRTLYAARGESGLAERIDAALAALGHANPQAVGALFTAFSFARDLEMPATRRDRALREVLGDLAPGIFMAHPEEQSSAARESVVNALIEHIAADAGRDPDVASAPAGLVGLMAALASPQAGERIYDPACRFGELLAAAGLATGEADGSAATHFFGETDDPVLAAVGAMRLLIARRAEQNIRCNAPLLQPAFAEGPGALARFDVVLSTLPPRIHPATVPSQRHYVQDPYRRFRRGTPAKQHPEMGFLQHMVECLAPGTGRLVGLFSRGVLVRGSDEQEVRRLLLEEGLVETVIALPEKLLFEHRAAPVLLVLRAGRTDDDVLLLDASDQYKARRHQNVLEDSHIARILELVAARRDVPGVARRVALDAIRAEDFSLHLPRYIRQDSGAPRSQAALRAEHAALLGELRERAAEVDALLDEGP